MPTSSLVSLNGQQIVVDCGLGVTKGLIDQNVDLRQLKTIIVTHLHSDHYLELGPLIHTAWTAGLKTPLAVWGPAGLETYWQAFLTSMEADIDLRQSDEGRPELAGLVTINTIEEVNFYSKDGLSITAMRNVHPPLVDTFALSFRTRAPCCFLWRYSRCQRWSISPRAPTCLSTKRCFFPALKPLSRVLAPVMTDWMNHLLRSHTLAEQAAAIAKQAGVKALALHHLIPSDDPDYGESDRVAAVTPHYSGTLHVGKDGLRIPL